MQRKLNIDIWRNNKERNNYIAISNWKQIERVYKIGKDKLNECLKQSCSNREAQQSYNKIIGV